MPSSILSSPLAPVPRLCALHVPEGNALLTSLGVPTNTLELLYGRKLREQKSRLLGYRASLPNVFLVGPTTRTIPASVPLELWSAIVRRCTASSYKRLVNPTTNLLFAVGSRLDGLPQTHSGQRHKLCRPIVDVCVRLSPVAVIRESRRY